MKIAVYDKKNATKEIKELELYNSDGIPVLIDCIYYWGAFSEKPNKAGKFWVEEKNPSLYGTTRATFNKWEKWVNKVQNTVRSLYRLAYEWYIPEAVDEYIEEYIPEGITWKEYPVFLERALINFLFDNGRDKA